MGAQHGSARCEKCPRDPVVRLAAGSVTRRPDQRILTVAQLHRVDAIPRGPIGEGGEKPPRPVEERQAWCPSPMRGLSPGVRGVIARRLRSIGALPVVPFLGPIGGAVSDVEHLGRRRDDVDITDIAYMRELEQHAQRRAEHRIELAHASLDRELTSDGEYEEEQLAGPYCGCTTCDVREILDAAWPYLQRLAASTCWCGGHRGPRDLPDADGWGCLEDIFHRGER